MPHTDTIQTKRLIWFSRILRWALGGLFIAVGVAYAKEGGWPAIIFGVVFFATGFFRPQRCLEDNCEV